MGFLTGLGMFGIAAPEGYVWELHWDWFFVLIFAAIAISIIFTVKVRKGFGKYSRYFSSRGLTGSRICEQILLRNNAEKVKIKHVSGVNKDDYDITKKEIQLSENVYSSASVSAASMSAYQCAHAIQELENYAPKNRRDTFMTLVDFASIISWPLILVGLVMGMSFYGGWILKAGCIVFCVSTLFHICTLGTEKDAARRAYGYLSDQNILEGEELAAAKEVTDALSYTYVANSCVLLAQIVKILFVGWRRRRKEQEKGLGN